MKTIQSMILDSRRTSKCRFPLWTNILTVGIGPGGNPVVFYVADGDQPGTWEVDIFPVHTGDSIPEGAEVYLGSLFLLGDNIATHFFRSI